MKSRGRARRSERRLHSAGPSQSRCSLSSACPSPRIIALGVGGRSSVELSSCSPRLLINCRYRISSSTPLGDLCHPIPIIMLLVLAYFPFVRFSSVELCRAVTCPNGNNTRGQFFPVHSRSLTPILIVSHRPSPILYCISILNISSI